jgi:hypothetical protein
MGILAPKRCPLIRISTVLTDTWHPKYTSSRIRVGVAKRFMLAYRAISLSSLGVVLRDVPDRRRSPIIPVAGKRSTRRPITAWCTHICHATLIFIKHARDMLTGCHLSAKVIYYLIMKTLYTKTLQPQLASTLCVIMYDTNCKPVLNENDFIDGWHGTHLTNAYVYIYYLRQSHFKKVNL